MDQKVPLEQILAAIPAQRQCELKKKISDAHLAKIAKDLIKWKSVCTNLGISEAEEKAIEGDNKEVDVQRYLHTACFFYRDYYAGIHTVLIRRAGKQPIPFCMVPIFRDECSYVLKL